VESGENGRTKLGSFLVFLVALVAEYGMGWNESDMDEMETELGLWGGLLTSHMQLKCFQ
jgi:hypothetical protein